MGERNSTGKLLAICEGIPWIERRGSASPLQMHDSTQVELMGRALSDFGRLGIARLMKRVGSTKRRLLYLITSRRR